MPRLDDEGMLVEWITEVAWFCNGRTVRQVQLGHSAGYVRYFLRSLRFIVGLSWRRRCNFCQMLVLQNCGPAQEPTI